MTYLLDTNVVSEARKTNANPGVRAWLAGARSEDLFLSALTIGEIRRGVERLRRRDPAQAEVFERWLDQVRRDAADQILPITPDVAEEWGRLNVPDPLPVIDGLIAATARVHRLTLVTRNTGDFARSGVGLLNPFD